MPRPDGGAAPDRRDRQGAGPRGQVRAAGRADCRARARGCAPAVRARAAAHRAAGSRCSTSPTIWKRSSRSATTSSVLRDGELVLTAAAAQLSKEELIAAMVGSASVNRERCQREPAQTAGRDARARAEPVLIVERLTASSARGRLDGVSLQVGRGEVVGVTGLLGAGVATLGRAIAGAEAHDSGQIRLHGQAHSGRTPGSCPARRDRLHPGGPQGRGLRRAPRRRGERHDDHHRPAG